VKKIITILIVGAFSLAPAVSWAAPPFDIIGAINDLNDQLAELEAEVTTLQSDLAAEIAAREQGDLDTLNNANAYTDAAMPSLAGQTCPAGEYVTGFDASGDIICSGEGGGAEVGPDCANPGPRTDLHNCDLSGANLANYDLTAANLSGANLTNAIMTSVILFNANLTGADLSGADLFTEIYYLRANLRGANLSGTTLIGTNLGNTILEGVNMTNADATGANLSDADLRYADLSYSNLTNVNLTNAYLYWTILGYANLSGADLTGVTWIQTICPDTTNSSNVGGTCEGHLSP